MALSAVVVLFILDVVDFVDLIGEPCTDDAADECSEFRPVVPLSEEFNSTAFEHYCRYILFRFTTRI